MSLFACACEGMSSAEGVPAAHPALMRLVRLPTSPLKPSALLHNNGQNVVVGQQPGGGGGGGGLDLGVLLEAAKPVQVLTASADSTADEDVQSENRADVGTTTTTTRKRKGEKAATKRAKQTTKAAKSAATSKSDKHLVVATTLNGVPFVKHHHSVKKPQTPSVSRR